MAIDALICVGLPALWRTRSLPLSGIPLLALTFCIAQLCAIFPSSMDSYARPDPYKSFVLLVCVDALQTIVHILTHFGYLGHMVRQQHLVHHTHTLVHPSTAFHTGILDALLQLILPLFVALRIVEPDRTTAILFGLFFSQWLIYIHTPRGAPGLRIPGLVTPEYHQKHHFGKGHYAHVFAII